jgi:hypothetical protein
VQGTWPEAVVREPLGQSIFSSKGFSLSISLCMLAFPPGSSQHSWQDDCFHIPRQVGKGWGDLVGSVKGVIFLRERRFGTVSRRSCKLRPRRVWPATSVGGGRPGTRGGGGEVGAATGAALLGLHLTLGIRPSPTQPTGRRLSGALQTVAVIISRGHMKDLVCSLPGENEKMDGSHDDLCIGHPHYIQRPYRGPEKQTRVL